MLKISSYQNFCVGLCVICINTYDYGKKKSYTTDQERLQQEEGFRQGKRHVYRMRCRAVFLKSIGLTSEQVGLQTEMTHISVNSRGKHFETEGIKGLEARPGIGRMPIMDCPDEEAVRIAVENDRQSVKKAKEAW